MISNPTQRRFFFFVVGGLWLLVLSLVSSASSGCTTPTTPQPDGSSTEKEEILIQPAKVSISDVAKIVPGSAFPAEVQIQPANNNLDVIDFEGRLVLAFRTAPSHFASSEVRLYIVSTTDQKTWRFEAAYHQKTDLREPRFFSWKGTLFLYFVLLGKDAASFEPGSMVRVERKADGTWTQPDKVFDTGFIVWRVKEHQGKPLMLGYEGGENIYNFSGKPLKVYLMTTEDGRLWKPLNPQKPVVIEGGASETDIAFDATGDLYAVARNEAGDSTGFGSKICRAPKSDLTSWTCHPDRKKYDSPLLLSYQGEVYLIGRKNQSPTGDYDLQYPDDEYDQTQKLYQYQLDYWKHPKRCAVWFLQRKTMKIQHLLDLPSRGDTCFPSALPRGEGKFLVYNYSSEIEGEDVAWLRGQREPTMIYAMLLTFQPK